MTKGGAADRWSVVPPRKDKRVLVPVTSPAGRGVVTRGMTVRNSQRRISPGKSPNRYDSLSPSDSNDDEEDEEVPTHFALKPVQPRSKRTRKKVVDDFFGLDLLASVIDSQRAIDEDERARSRVTETNRTSSKQPTTQPTKVAEKAKQKEAAVKAAIKAAEKAKKKKAAAKKPAANKPAAKKKADGKK